MQRIASALLLGGGVLLVTWVAAPAAPSRPPAPVSAAELAAFAQAAPALAEMSAQVDRLRERLASTPQYPAPSRDPFRFGQRPEPARPKSPSLAAPPEPLAAPAPVLPRLVAVMTDGVAGPAGAAASDRTPPSSAFTAVLAVGDDVQIVKAGDSVAGFTVRSVGLDAIELVDRTSGATFRISLR